MGVGEAVGFVGEGKAGEVGGRDFGGVVEGEEPADLSGLEFVDGLHGLLDQVEAVDALLANEAGRGVEAVGGFGVDGAGEGRLEALVDPQLRYRFSQNKVPIFVDVECPVDPEFLVGFVEADGQVVAGLEEEAGDVEVVQVEGVEVGYRRRPGPFVETQNVNFVRHFFGEREKAVGIVGFGVDEESVDFAEVGVVEGGDPFQVQTRPLTHRHRVGLVVVGDQAQAFGGQLEVLCLDLDLGNQGHLGEKVHADFRGGLEEEVALDELDLDRFGFLESGEDASGQGGFVRKVNNVKSVGVSFVHKQHFFVLHVVDFGKALVVFGFEGGVFGDEAEAVGFAEGGKDPGPVEEVDEVGGFKEVVLVVVDEGEGDGEAGLHPELLDVEFEEHVALGW